MLRDTEKKRKITICETKVKVGMRKNDLGKTEINIGRMENKKEE